MMSINCAHRLYLQINQGYLFSVTKDLDHPFCKDMMGSHSQCDLRSLVGVISLIKMNKCGMIQLDMLNPGFGP